MRGREAVEGDANPVAAYRDDVRAALRRVIGQPFPDTVRAEALRALGRAGWDADAPLFLKLLEAKGTKLEIREAAAIGLGLLPKFEDPAIRDRVRDFATRLIDGKLPISQRARLMGLMALGIRARGDAFLTAGLGARARRPLGDADDAAALLYALGLTGDPMLGLELKAAVHEGKLGDRRLHDVTRAHATIALALCGDASAVDTFSRILNGDEHQVQTRRSAAIAMGIILREQDLPEKIRQVAVRVLERVMAGDRDPLVAGFAAVGLGYAKKPAGIDALIRVAGKSGGAVEGPYAVLALGLAARRLPDEKADKIRRFLVTSYANCRDLDRSGAFAIAAGIAGATDASELFLKAVKNSSNPLRVRAFAAQALGLLGKRSDELEKLLRQALDDGAPMISENSAIALGLLGRSGTAEVLVTKLVETRSKSLQIHMVVALAHLGGTRAIAPLVKILNDGKADDRVLECAANVLGILVDTRETDPLFEIDSSVNLYGMTVVTRNMVTPF
jgi:HEAT repeat protein